LCDGDITKLKYILWETTPDELEPYLKFKIRDKVFREKLNAVLCAFGIRTEEEERQCSKIHNDDLYEAIQWQKRQLTS